MIKAPAVDGYDPLHITYFGHGLIAPQKEAPSHMPHGAALRSINCDYEAGNIAARLGYRAVLENGPGALKIADFESGEAWSGGAAETGTDNFVVNEAAATGTRSRRLDATGGGAEVTTELSFGALSLGTEWLDVFHLWVKATALPGTITGYTLTLRFETSGGNHWQATIATATDLRNALELARAKYHRFRRQDFLATGTPNWTSITKIRVGLQATGSGTLSVAVDNLHRTPGVVQELFQFRRQEGAFAGASGEYAVAGGTLYRNDGVRWVSVFVGFDTLAPVYSLTAQDKQLLSDGVTTPRVLMPDGTTVYRMGIVTPPKTLTATQIAGGGLTDQKYYAQVLFYSSKTGAFSAPDDRVPATPILTVTAGGNAAGIRFQNIPVSADPQVDWVIIGVRPETEPEVFYRITDGIHGDVPNGTTTFDWKDIPGGARADVSTLLGRSATAIDPDLDYPSVVDAATMLPVEAHPLFMAEAGGYIVTVMAERPTVLRISRFREPLSWAIDDEIPIGENDSEPISGLAKTGTILMIGKRTAVHYGGVVGGDTKIVVDDSVSEHGPLDHKGIIQAGNVLRYRGQDGIYSIGSDLIPRRVTSDQIPIWLATWDHHGFGVGAAVLIREREQVIHFGRPLGGFYNDTGWVTHIREVPQAETGHRTRRPGPAPSLYTIPGDVATEVRATTGWEAWTGGMGQVWRLNVGHEDDGRMIETTHRTPLIRRNPAAACRWRWLDIEADPAGDADLTVRCFMGPTVSQDSAPQADLKSGSTFGEYVLGTSKLGAPLYRLQRLKLPRTVCRYVSFELYFRARLPLNVVRLTPWTKPVSTYRPNV